MGQIPRSIERISSFHYIPEIMLVFKCTVIANTRYLLNVLFYGHWAFLALLINCFYRAMHYSAKCGLAIACRPSVRLSDLIWCQHTAIFSTNSSWCHPVSDVSDIKMSLTYWQRGNIWWEWNFLNTTFASLHLLIVRPCSANEMKFGYSVKLEFLRCYWRQRNV